MAVTAASDDGRLLTGRPNRPRPWWLRPVATAAVLASAFLVWQLVQVYLADTHVTDRLEQALAERDAVDVVAVLPFDPEQFHSDFFTECCSIARVEGRSFFLTGASKHDVEHIGRQYWVESVDLWEGAVGG